MRVAQVPLEYARRAGSLGLPVGQGPWVCASRRDPVATPAALATERDPAAMALRAAVAPCIAGVVLLPAPSVSRPPHPRFLILPLLPRLLCDPTFFISILHGHM